MRQGSLSLLLVLCLASPLLHAQEETAAPAERQLEPGESSAANEAGSRDPALNAEQMQLAQLRQENQRLRMQLHEEQAKIQSQSQPQLLNEQQQWFAIGGGVGVLGFLLGVLSTRSRRRRQWLN